jgi:hypothetical protein
MSNIAERAAGAVTVSIKETSSFLIFEHPAKTKQANKLMYKY